MAIVKGLEEGAVLAKYTSIQKQGVRDPNNHWRYLYENGRRVERDVTFYHVIKLYSRRNRTNGCLINESLKPFFEKLKVKLIPNRHVKNGRQYYRYVAVGCESITVTEESYADYQVDEIAEKHFKKIKNHELLQLMKQNEEPEFVIQALKNVIEEETATEAIDFEEGETVPAEPRFREYHNETVWP